MARRIGTQTTGGPRDESLSPRALVLIEALRADEGLPGKIGALVGEYRLLASYRDTAPDRDAQLKHSDKAVKNIDTLLDSVNAMPENIKALASEKLFQMTGEHYEQVTERLTIDLMRYRAVCKDAKNTLEQWHSNPGEKPKRVEDELLSDVAALLAPIVSTKQGQAAKAADILTAAGIPHFFGTPKALADRITRFRASR